MSTELMKLVLASDNKIKIGLANLLDAIGFFQFRIVRYLFSLNDVKLHQISKIFHDQHSHPLLSEWKDLCRRWKIVESPQPLFNPKIKKIKEESLNDQNSLNIRTRLVNKKLARDLAFDQKNQILKIEGKDYRVLNSDVIDLVDSSLPFVSCGSSSEREFLIFDPKNSPILESSYREFCFLMLNLNRKLKKKLTVEEFSSALVLFIQKNVFSLKNQSERLDHFIAQCAKDPKYYKDKKLCIPIDEFIKNKIGLCRHHAPVADYFFQRFMKHHPDQCFFMGKVQMVRDNVIGGAHQWLTFINDDGTNFCIDTLNQIIGNLNDKSFHGKLEKVFGAKAVAHQVKIAQQVRDRG